MTTGVGKATAFRPNQFVTVNMNAAATTENQALGSTVNDVRKALIHPLCALARQITGSVSSPVNATFADSGGNPITSGSATHIKLTGGDSNSPANSYNLMIQEWD